MNSQASSSTKATDSVASLKRILKQCDVTHLDVICQDQWLAVAINTAVSRALQQPAFGY